MNTPSPTQPKPLEGAHPQYDALLKKIESLPRIEGDRMLREFAKKMEETYMDSRFDDITKAGSIAIWEAVQKLSPWAESNDMPWEDEILCGLYLAMNNHATLKRKAEMAGKLAGALEPFAKYACEKPHPDWETPCHNCVARASLSKYKQESST